MEIRRPSMFKEAEQGKCSKLWLQILIFVAVFYVTMTAESIPIAVYMVIGVVRFAFTAFKGTSISSETLEQVFASLQTGRGYLYTSLFSTILAIVIALVFCKYIEKRPIHSMGLGKEHILPDYLIGLLVGFVMFSAVIGINLLTGAMTFDGIASGFGMSTIGYVIIFLIGFLIQGASEELIMRGYLMNSIGAKHKMITAVIVSSVAFGVIHALNPGVTVLAIINIVLIGVFFCVYAICFDNIWGVCALHGAWNFVQGNFYGIQVSGMTVQDTIFTLSSVEGKQLINGGSFGAEGGLATTIVVLISLAVLLIYMKLSGRMNKTAFQ